MYLWVWVLDLLYFAETHCCAIIIQKNYTDLVTDFLPATESPMSRLQRQIYCVCGRKWWVITLLIFSSRPPSPSTTLSHSDQGRFFFFFYAYAKHDEWMVLFVAYRRVYDFLWDFSEGLSPAGLDPSFASSVLIECVAEMSTYSLSYALMHWPLRLHIMSTQWSLSPERAAQPGARTRF